jgi:hypothetical protein
MIIFANVFAGDRLTNGERVPFLNERDIVNDKNAILANGGEVFDDAFRT